MIDFHCHVDLYPDPESMLRGLPTDSQFVLCVTTTPAAWARTQELCSKYPQVETAVGLHPELVSSRHSEVGLLADLIRSVPFVGEVGIDGSPDFKASWGRQVQVFDEVLKACADAGGRVISIHSRRASREVCDRLKRQMDCGTPVLHWFSGPVSDLKTAIDLGCFFSIGPPMLETSAGRRLVAAIPRERALTETDGPFVHVEGAPALPGQVGRALAGLAEVWKVDVAEVVAQVAANSIRIFSRHNLRRRLVT